MKTTTTPPNETERLAALASYNILDTSPETAFDELTTLISRICGTPISLISLIDKDRQWFKSRVGWEITETPRHLSFCAHALSEEEFLVVEDASRDARFADHPFVTSAPFIRFYAGMALITPDGFRLGSLCVLHQQPHQLDPTQCEAIKIMARQIMAQFELKKQTAELARAREEFIVTESRLRDSETFYQTLVESLPQNIIRKDSQGRFTFANQKFCQSIGRPQGELIGKTDFDLYPSELASKYHRDDLRVMATRENLDTVEAHQPRPGEKLFVHVIKTPLYDANGQVVGIQGIFWDVTHRKKIEEALAYERDLLRALLDNIPDRIYFKDVHSRFLRCSSSMAKRLGLDDPTKVVGKTDFDFHPRELAQEFYSDEQRIILTGQPLINKLERQHETTGEEIWASVTKVPIYNQNGAVTGIIGISRDVTQLKKAEKELEMARDAALESARIKSQFLANMSHEIRTPMNAITGMTGLLKDTPMDSEQREFVDTISNSTATLLAIINEILDYSKLEAGKVHLETIDFNLVDTVESTVKMLGDTAQSKGLELVCGIATDIPEFWRGDPGRFRQILANLLSNAVKFTLQGEVVVLVRMEEVTEQNAIICVEVKDTGIGIATESLAQIFEAFTQADGSTTRKFGGTGLGLTISKQLVELMRGSLTVESEAGLGSTFSLRLSFTRTSGSGSSTQAMPLTEHLAGKRILVVDNSATCRQILLDQLRHWKMEASEAATHEEAIRIFHEANSQSVPFHVVLLDMDMPEGNGLNLALRLQSEATPSPVGFLVMTCYRSEAGPETLRNAGICGRLIKPVNRRSLLEALIKALSPELSLMSFAEDAQRKARAREARLPECKRARILLAEDNSVNQRVALSQLKKLGYSADAVANGAEVLRAMQRGDYDIILMDCQMPEMDGYEVTRRLRQAEFEKPSPHRKTSPYIIALTANTLQGDRERCLEAGMNDYLTKPIDLAALESVLARAEQFLQPKSDLQGTQVPNSSEDLLDRRILQGLRDLKSESDPDPLGSLVELYLKDSKSRLKAMAQALEKQDAPRLTASAHSMKGSSNNLGAKTLGALCHRLELAGKAGDLTSASPLLQQVADEFVRVEQALHEYLAL